jgi:hypothetical protein
MTRKEEKPQLIYKDENYAVIGASLAETRNLPMFISENLRVFSRVSSARKMTC